MLSNLGIGIFALSKLPQPGGRHALKEVGGQRPAKIRICFAAIVHAATVIGETFQRRTWFAAVALATSEKMRRAAWQWLWAIMIAATTQ
jgi:hypothetical protein